MIVAGIDAGSRAIKVVLMEAVSRAVLGTARGDQGVEQDRLATALLEGLVGAHGDGRRPGYVVATGYGRSLVSAADTTITEITCHARGVRELVPEVRTVVEVGGQDSKVIRLEADGSVRDFMMNDRCAAGTGRFLEVVAARLGVGIDRLGELAASSSRPAAISSTCVVFAETEIIGLLASGARPEDIVAGVQHSIASRVVAMTGRSAGEPIVFTGGVALVPGMREALQAVLTRPVLIAPDPQMTGALGAALLAASRGGAVAGSRRGA
jgi:predicted CoA-substrate-specific enzyme activase